VPFTEFHTKDSHNLSAAGVSVLNIFEGVDLSKDGNVDGAMPPVALALCRRREFDEGIMNDHIYKKIELVGSSPIGIEDAVNNAVNRASKTIRNMRWFEVAELRGHIEDNKVAHWQVTVKIGFTLDT